MDRPGIRQVPEGNGEQGKIAKTGCKIICGAPTTLAVKGQMRERERERERVGGAEPEIDNNVREDFGHTQA